MPTALEDHSTEDYSAEDYSPEDCNAEAGSQARFPRKRLFAKKAAGSRSSRPRLRVSRRSSPACRRPPGVDLRAAAVAIRGSCSLRPSSPRSARTRASTWSRPVLFRRFPTPAADMAKASLPEIEEDHSHHRLLSQQGQISYLRGSERPSSSASQRAKVPRTMEELLTVPGAARKTANVVLGVAYNIAVGIVVDTHVLRLSRRLELTLNTEPKKVEQDLMKIIPKDHWIDFSHELILHGRAMSASPANPAAPTAPWSRSAIPVIRPGAAIRRFRCKEQSICMPGRWSC